MEATSRQGRSGANGFTGLTLPRCAERRGDAAWLAAQIRHPESRFYPLVGERVFVKGDPLRAASLSCEDLDGRLERAECVVFLGCEHGTSHFAVGLAEDERLDPLERRGSLRGLRGAAPLLTSADAGLLAYARAMVLWHRTARFCGSCGTNTHNEQGGFVRRCSSVACGREQFPRTDPAIIVLVRHGERCLLGRQPWWEPRRFSVIAGFVEPGESFEAAVVREVWEETGLPVDTVRYRSSQPWPFPASIMVGFRARACSEEIRLRDQELEAARWFTREELQSDIKSGQVLLPYTVSISYRLIQEWFDAAPGFRLADVCAER